MDGYLASVGLVKGDVIVGIDGITFDGSKSAQTVLRGMLMAKKENQLIVQRGTQRLLISVDSAKFNKATANAHDATILQSTNR